MVIWHGGQGPGWQLSEQGWPHARVRVQGPAQECGVSRRGGLGSGVEPQKHLEGELGMVISCERGYMLTNS